MDSATQAVKKKKDMRSVGPLRLKFHSRSRTRLRIAASIVLVFALIAKGFRHYRHHCRAVEPREQLRMRRLRIPATVCGCKIG